MVMLQSSALICGRTVVNDVIKLGGSHSVRTQNEEIFPYGMKQELFAA